MSDHSSTSGPNLATAPHRISQPAALVLPFRLSPSFSFSASLRHLHLSVRNTVSSPCLQSPSRLPRHLTLALRLARSSLPHPARLPRLFYPLTLTLALLFPLPFSLCYSLPLGTCGESPVSTSNQFRHLLHTLALKPLFANKARQPTSTNLVCRVGEQVHLPTLPEPTINTRQQLHRLINLQDSIQAFVLFTLPKL